MRSSLFALGGLFAVAALSACSITSSDGVLTIKTQTKYNEDNVAREAPAAWAGEKIVIDAAGVGAAIGRSGIEIHYDSSATTVRASASLVGYADADDKPSADASIVDAKGTYAITTAGGTTTVACGHGSEHGTSKSGNSGCQLIIVTVPGGSSALPISVKGLSGNGDVTVTGHGAIMGSLEINAQNGDIDVIADANLGSSVSAKSANGDVTIHLPATFSADKINLVADDPFDPAVPDIVTSSFPTLVNGASYGTAGTGATLIAAERDGIGKVTLTSQ